jgi:hypothetical protein
MLSVGRVTRMVAGGCAVCHGGVWFAQGRKVRPLAAPRPPVPCGAFRPIASRNNEGLSAEPRPQLTTKP